jgi:hypothetical protein
MTISRRGIVRARSPARRRLSALSGISARTEAACAKSAGQRAFVILTSSKNESAIFEHNIGDTVRPQFHGRGPLTPVKIIAVKASADVCGTPAGKFDLS